MNKGYALLLPLIFVGCSSVTQLSSTFGTLKPGGTLTVVANNATINVYKPAVGDPPDRYTITASVASNASPQPSPPTIRRAGAGIVVTAPDPLDGLLVRLPDETNLVVQSKQGNVSVTNVSGNVDVNAGVGNVKIIVSNYAQATTQTGNIDATIGATQWPGTLTFSAQSGDVTVYVSTVAKFHVRMHTDDGTLFTDFGLRGSALGKSETIDTDVNGGSSNGIEIRSHSGTVRLLRLAPQA